MDLPFRRCSHPALAFAALLSVACTLENHGGADEPPHPGAGIYLQYCASCHGVALDGRGGSSLLLPDLRHGSAREDIFRSIHDGIVEMGMPAYGDAFSDDQIDDLVDYIVRFEDLGDAALPARERRSYDRIQSIEYNIGVEVWVEGLNIPWALAFIDDRVALVTERPGRLRIVEDGVLIPTPVQGTPEVLARGQGGMLDVAIDPDYEENGWIYLSFSHEIDGGRGMTKVVRGRLSGEEWIDEETLFEADHDSYNRSGVHYGSRIAFCDAGYLYFAIGDRGRMHDAQRLDLPNGKIHRIGRDGSVPDDNPFVGEEGALPTIWSYGHRNPQGLAFHPVTGDLWSTEHGPRGGDELNLVLPGVNYGWPVITYGINYDGTIITRRRTHPEMEQPVWVWTPSTGTCGMAFLTSDEFPFWENQLLAGGLATEDLRVLLIEDQRVIHEEVLYKGFARTRDVRTGPDGAIYVVLNNARGEILRLTNQGERFN